MSNRGPKVALSLAVALCAVNSFSQSTELLTAVRTHDGKAIDLAKAELAACATTQAKHKPCARQQNLSLLTGVLLLSSSESEAAAKQLSAVTSPKGLQAYHLWYLAEAQSWSGQVPSAVKTLQKIQKAPAGLQERITPRLGELLLQAGKPAQALKILIPAATKSMSPELLLARAQAYAATGDEHNAAADYKTIAIRYPTHPHGAIARAALGPEALLTLSQDEQVTRIVALQTAGALNDTLSAIDGLGEPTGKFASATKAKLALIRGQVLLLKGKDADAFTQLDLASATGTAQVAADALNTKARRLMRVGQNAEAQKYFRQLETRFPSDVNADDAGYYASWLNMSSGDDAAAALQFEEFENVHTSSRKRDEARWFRAFALLRMRQFAKSRDVLTSLATDFPRSQLVPQALYWATRCAQLTPPVDGGAVVDATAEYKAVIAGFPGSIYAWFARERLRDLGVEVPPMFANHPKSLKVSVPPELTLAADLAQTGLFRDSAEETTRALTAATAETAITWGHALQSLGDFGSAHTLAARYLWSSVYGTRAPEALALMYPEAWEDSVRHWAETNGVSPYFAWAIMRRESAFRPEVSSSADARGLMQIIPPTATQISKEMKIDTVHADALFAPETNVQLGTWYLSALLTRMGHIATASASYNAGPTAVSKWVKARGDLPLDQWIEEIPYKETRGYVKQVVADTMIYSELYGDSAAPALSMRLTPAKAEGVQF